MAKVGIMKYQNGIDPTLRKAAAQSHPQHPHQTTAIKHTTGGKEKATTVLEVIRTTMIDIAARAKRLLERRVPTLRQVCHLTENPNHQKNRLQRQYQDFHDPLRLLQLHPTQPLHRSLPSLQLLLSGFRFLRLKRLHRNLS